MNKEKAWVSWSTGKDSAYALHLVRNNPDLEVTGLITTITEPYDRVSMHAVREEMLDRQAQQLGLPVRKIKIPPSCTNAIYEARMEEAIGEAKMAGVTVMIFGDLFLRNVRAYREKNLEGSGIEARFPLWNRNTCELALEMIENGLKAVLTCVDPRVLDPSFAGRVFDDKLLDELPNHVDACGENGEFHTFVFDGPFFKSSIPLTIGERLEREGFYFADVFPRLCKTSQLQHRATSTAQG